MSSALINIIRFGVFLFVQIFVLLRIEPLHQFIVPYLYMLFILWLPFSIKRFLLLIVGFLYGLSLDYFLGHYGLHAACCTLIAYLRPFILQILIPKETTEQSFREPSIKSMGFGPYGLYVFVLVFTHHTYLVLIEWLSFGSFFYFLGKTLATTAISLLLIFITEMLFYRKAKLREI